MQSSNLLKELTAKALSEIFNYMDKLKHSVDRRMKSISNTGATNPNSKLNSKDELNSGSPRPSQDDPVYAELTNLKQQLKMMKENFG